MVCCLVGNTSVIESASEKKEKIFDFRGWTEQAPFCSENLAFGGLELECDSRGFFAQNRARFAFYLAGLSFQAVQ